MLDTEKEIISCFIADFNYCYDKVYSKLKPEMFLNPFYKDCYIEMLALHDMNEEITLVSLANQLENRERSKETVSEMLVDVVSVFTTSVNISTLVDVLSKEYRSVEIKNLIDHIDLSPKAINNSLGEIMARCEALKENTIVKAKSFKQIVKENQDNYFVKREVELVKTGLYRLDDCLGGLEGGDITVVGARPAVGKSAFVTQIIKNVAEQGKKVGYFNLEMNESQVYERFAAMLSGIDLTRIRRATAFLGDEKERFESANEEISKYDIYISTGGKTISQVKSECRHQRFDLIVIDYLQLIKADKSYGNRASEVGAISKDIKALAMELDVPIILLSQLNRATDSADRATKEPTMADLRESGDIEQDASNIILLWRCSDYETGTGTQFRGLKVDKQRQGMLLKEGLEFEGKHMTFRESNKDYKLFLKSIKDIEKSAADLEELEADGFDPFA